MQHLSCLFGVKRKEFLSKVIHAPVDHHHRTKAGNNLSFFVTRIRGDRRLKICDEATELSFAYGTYKFILGRDLRRMKVCKIRPVGSATEMEAASHLLSSSSRRCAGLLGTFH